MIMPKSKAPLAEQADRIFAALKALGPGWYGRADIAKQLGKARLNAYDTAALDFLVIMEMVEAEVHVIASNISQRQEYRIKGDDLNE